MFQKYKYELNKYIKCIQKYIDLYDMKKKIYIYEIINMCKSYIFIRVNNGIFRHTFLRLTYQLKFIHL